MVEIKPNVSVSSVGINNTIVEMRGVYGFLVVSFLPYRIWWKYRHETTRWNVSNCVGDRDKLWCYILFPWWGQDCAAGRWRQRIQWRIGFAVSFLILFFFVFFMSCFVALLHFIVDVIKDIHCQLLVQDPRTSSLSFGSPAQTSRAIYTCSQYSRWIIRSPMWSHSLCIYKHLILLVYMQVY